MGFFDMVREETTPVAVKVVVIGLKIRRERRGHMHVLAKPNLG